MLSMDIAGLRTDRDARCLLNQSTTVYSLITCLCSLVPNESFGSQDVKGGMQRRSGFHSTLRKLLAEYFFCLLKSGMCEIRYLILLRFGIFHGALLTVENLISSCPSCLRRPKYRNTLRGFTDLRICTCQASFWVIRSNA
ncbi:hypothetical protein BT93_B1250 [Corymbia citriodora subsp. variegata]|nr:hypothetical protein BT93_B1250 [Corymbia citriodora subsp. variegata]